MMFILNVVVATVVAVVLDVAYFLWKSTHKINSVFLSR